MRPYDYLISVIIGVVILFNFLPFAFSCLEEIHKQEVICEYEYNVDNCHFDYSNDYIKVFKTGKGYVIEEN